MNFFLDQPDLEMHLQSTLNGYLCWFVQSSPSCLGSLRSKNFAFIAEIIKTI